MGVRFVPDERRIRVSIDGRALLQRKGCDQFQKLHGLVHADGRAMVPEVRLAVARREMVDDGLSIPQGDPQIEVRPGDGLPFLLAPLSRPNSTLTFSPRLSSIRLYSRRFPFQKGA